MTRAVLHAQSSRASRSTSCRDGGGRPLLLLHGLGEQSPEAVPTWAAAVAGAGLGARLHRARRLDGAGGRRLHRRGADGRRRHRARPRRRRRRCWGAASARTSRCSSPGARPSLVHGAVLCRRPRPRRRRRRPDVERRHRTRSRLPPRLHARPVRAGRAVAATCGRPTTPPRSRARRCSSRRPTRRSSVCTRWRPPWLEAVVNEPGVLECPTLGDALTLFA